MLFLYIAIGYFIFINFLAFISMGIDKHKAKSHKYRIPEKVLFGIAILGGSVGSGLGMSVFRHKTKHKSFVLGVPFIFLVQIILIFICYRISF